MTHFSKPRLYPDLLNHVIFKSLDNQCLFREDADRNLFLYFLRESIKKHDLQIYAYGLMEEHIHLFFRTPHAPSQALYLLKKSYSLSYKRKYKTKKALFQPLYKAETASDPVALVCFICRDPVRQGYVSDPFYSSWTSIGIFQGEDLPADRKALLALTGENAWIHLLSRPLARSFMEYNTFPSPKETRLIIQSMCSQEEKNSFQCLPPNRKKEILVNLRSCGVTYNSIRESLGISKYEIDLALGKIRSLPGAGGKSPTPENGCSESLKS